MEIIYVVDSIMGSGKTSAAINKMNEDKQNNYIFITPYLKEVDRIKESCSDRIFAEPENKGDGKLDSLHYLLDRGYNIASTHALFKTYSEYTMELIKLNNYKLILDEVFDVVEHIKIHKDDLKMLIAQKIIKIDADGYVVWLNDSYGGDFKFLKPMAKNHTIIMVDGYLMLFTFPVGIFECFKEIYILTYLFNAQKQKYYYDLNNIKFEYIGVEMIEKKYVFSKNIIIPEYAKKLKDKIHIIDDNKLNGIGSNQYALSVNWFENQSRNRGKYILKNLKKNLINLYNNKLQTTSDENMWTTFKTFQEYLTGKGYAKGFVSVNVRSTNDFRFKKYLSYCANIFFDPYLKKYFMERGVDVQEDRYALSEMIQWIWRSAIRDGNEITIYVPSARMRNLLIGWLEEISIESN